MEDIKLPIANIVKNNLSINEYLVLYNISNNNSISGLISLDVNDLTNLESKGFIKIIDNEVLLRGKSTVFFEENQTLFEEWLSIYPTMVSKSNGGKRALSPASPDTILGRILAKKWKQVFKADVDDQRKAIEVLRLEVKDKKKSGDLEFMVEATRWLNQGYHEKYSYLLDAENESNNYENEDYL